MLLFAYYLLKTIACTTILFGYYLIALRNKVFHKYNRYYLVAIILLSLILPICQINIFQQKDKPKTNIVKLLTVVTDGDEYVNDIAITGKQNVHFSLIQLLPFLYFMVCIILGILFLKMLLSIFVLLKKNTITKLKKVQIINTEAANGTPFSFFNYLFWNNQIDIYSPAGQRIFKHELAHINERHSYDKILINVLLIFFWINPVFWLIRRELNLVHEFIADKKAVEDGDTAALASMILAVTYPKHLNLITNNFYYSPIKRRLMMLTKKQQPRLHYFSRLLALPLLLIVFAAFTIKAKEYATTKKNTFQISNIKNTTFTDTTKNKIIQTAENNIKDKIKEAAPLNNETQFYTTKQITVVLDAGHGGNDNGASNTEGLLEKDLTLQLVKKIKELNNNQNIKIILTRDVDTFSSAHQKADFANAQKPDLFISVHINSSIKPNTEGGMVIYVAQDKYLQSEKSKALASFFLNTFKNNYPLEVPNTITQRKAGIWVLQSVNAASILIEPGHINNKKDAAYLQSEIGQSTFAKNVLNAINNYADNEDLSKAAPQVNYEDSTKYKGRYVKKIDVFMNTKEKQQIQYVQLTFLDNTTIKISEKEAKENGLSFADVGLPKQQAIQPILDADRRVFTKVEIEPEFIGGKEAWRNYVKQHLNAALPIEENWKAGTYVIIVRFIVEKDGTITDIVAENFEKSKTAAACVKLIKDSPKWKPALQNGHVVTSYKRQPITFVVLDEK